MAISMARVDDRVVHGQTITRWATVKPCNSILVISDEVASNELRVKALRAACTSIKLGGYDIANGPAALEKAKASKNNFFIIADTVQEFVKLKQAGGDWGNTLNCGSMSYSRGDVPSKRMGDGVVLTDADVEALDYLASQGIEINFQLTPDNTLTMWPEMKEKYLSA